MMSFIFVPENWVLLSFLLFVIFFGKRLWATVVGMLDSRAERIRHELDEARRLREDAAQTLAAYQARQQEALAEADAIVSRAKLEAENLRSKAEADLALSLKRREQQALDRITQMEASALAEVRALTVDLAVQASRQLLAQGLTLTDQDRLVERAINDISRKLN